MSDPHIRFLAMIARDSQRQLERHDALADMPDAAFAERRQGLAERAAQTRASLAAARARRWQTPSA